MNRQKEILLSGSAVANVSTTEGADNTAYKNRECIKWMRFKEEDILGKITGDVIYNLTVGKV